MEIKLKPICLILYSKSYFAIFHVQKLIFELFEVFFSILTSDPGWINFAYF
jgi:hypothetical protein